MAQGFDMNALFQQAQAIQEQLRRTQEELGKREVQGTAGGGMVVVTASGAGEIRRVQIDRNVVDPKDVGMLEDLIVAATNAALKAVQTLVQSEGGALANLQSMFPGMMP